MRFCKHLTCKFWAKNQKLLIVAKTLSWKEANLQLHHVHILELGTELTLIRSALKRGIRLCLLLLDLSDFWVSSYDLKFLFLKDRWCHTEYHAFYTNRSGLKKPQDEIHFCIKKEDDLCFILSWNKTAIHKKVEWKFITWKNIVFEISKGDTLKSGNFNNPGLLILSRPTKSFSLLWSKVNLHFSHNQQIGYGSHGETNDYI
jgi:hypothetical protein